MGDSRKAARDDVKRQVERVIYFIIGALKRMD